jgi:tripartite-type tricarboxylate transporter receptor subunit TctC
MTISRRDFLAGSGAWALAMSTRASAQGAYPSRAIRVVVPFPAGGTTDMLARVFAQHMSEGLGQSVIVENMGGAGARSGPTRSPKPIRTATPSCSTI